MQSEVSAKGSKFLEIARQVIKDERPFLVEIGKLGISKTKKEDFQTINENVT